MDEETVSQREVDADAVNGTSTPEQKAYPHPIAIVSAGRQSFLFPPTMVPLRPTPQNMSSLPPPCLTQASLYYSTHYIPAQQFSLGTQGSLLTAMPPLLQMQANNVPTERINDTKMEIEKQENFRKRKSSEDSEPVSFQLSPMSHHSMSSGGSLEDQNFKLEESSPCRMENSPPHTPASSSATSPMSPSTINALSPVNELCGICGDKATGHHYGVPSCEGCKGFFKRSVQNKKTYTCRNLTKDCPMDKRQRNRCQYCRFQKCLDAGMLKEAVREDRAPGGRHKSSLVNIKSVGQPPCKQPKKSVSELLPCKVSALASLLKPTPPPLPDLIQEIVSCNLQHTISNEQCLGCKETELKEKTLAHVTQLAEQQLVRSSSWFDQLLLLKDISTTDQEILIRNCWVELMLANLIKQSQDLEDKAMLCKEQILDYETAETTGIGDIMQRVVQMATRFRELELDNVEFVCMKIIVLLNPDVVGLQNQLQVENLQDRFHTALQNYITTNSPKDPNRFGNILLRLPELRSIGTKSIERLFMLNLTGQIHPSYSLSELLHSSKR